MKIKNEFMEVISKLKKNIKYWYKLSFKSHNSYKESKNNISKIDLFVDLDLRIIFAIQVSIYLLQLIQNSR